MALNLNQLAVSEYVSLSDVLFSVTGSISVLLATAFMPVARPRIR